ncbi:MAG: hypothetical protein AB7O24_18850 [Kofleriaceae bacterium]
MKTVAVSLWEGQIRGEKPNAATAIQLPVANAVEHATTRELFVQTYNRFSHACRAIEEPGVAIIAVDEHTRRAAGIVRLCARVGRTVAAIVGRHDRCDLYLPHGDQLALRQLAVVLGPVQSWQPGATGVRYRVIDLRTGHGMLDEHGRLLRGLRAEGPSIVRCAGYTLFILPIGDPSDWPERADDAWAMLPERVYFDELEHSPDGSMPRAWPRRGDSRKSIVVRTSAALDTGMRLASEVDIAGTLEISGPNRTVTLRVGHHALQSGVLLGRYGRCDGSELADDSTLSRVHALLIEDEHQLIVVDTASINGTRASGCEPARVNVLEDELCLGRRTRVRWRWLGG